MNFECVEWAYQQDISASQKFILVTLAHFANKDYECYPAIETLSKKCGVNRSTAMRAIKKLVDEKYLETFSRGGDGHGRQTNIYRFSKVAGCNLACGEPVDKGGLSRTVPLAKSHCAPQLKRREEREIGGNEQLSGFDKQVSPLEEKKNGARTKPNLSSIHRGIYAEIYAEEMGGGAVREDEVTLRELMDEAARRDKAGRGGGAA